MRTTRRWHTTGSSEPSEAARRGRAVRRGRWQEVSGQAGLRPQRCGRNGQQQDYRPAGKHAARGRNANAYQKVSWQHGQRGIEGGGSQQPLGRGYRTRCKTSRKTPRKTLHKTLATPPLSLLSLANSNRCGCIVRRHGAQHGAQHRRRRGANGRNTDGLSRCTHRREGALNLGMGVHTECRVTLCCTPRTRQWDQSKVCGKERCYVQCHQGGCAEHERETP